MVTFTHHRNNKQTATTTIMFYKKACDIKLSTFLLIIGPFSSLYLNSLIKLSRSNPKLLYEISFAVFLEEKKRHQGFLLGQFMKHKPFIFEKKTRQKTI